MRDDLINNSDVQYLRLVHTSCRSMQLSQRARLVQVAAKNWKNFYLATVYHRLQHICSVL